MSATEEPCTAAAAYVLGALAGTERRAFEDHLAGCPDCARTVADLAGIPGLLARVAPDDLTRTDVPLPDTMLPRLLGAVRRRDRARRLAALGLAAAAVLAVLLALVGAPGAGHDRSTPPGVTMTRLVSAPVSASVDLEPDGRATRIDMRCWYDVDAYGDLPSYDLVVTDTGGHAHRVAHWRVGPDGNTRVVASVGLPRNQIRTVEVEAADGRPVLRLERQVAGG